MKVPLSWLRRYLRTEADVAAIAGALTRIGLEVEGIDNPGEALRPFTIARVLAAGRHPAADRLQLLEVETGAGAPVRVVCGAPNARPGLVGVFAPPGTHVPGLGVTLRVATIRGVESWGMMCSARELGLGDDHEGIIELPPDAPVGLSYASWAGLDDPVIEVAVTPNRPDCLGIYGIARDLAAAGLGTLEPIAVPELAGAFPCPVAIRIEDTDGCPAFFARALKGVRNGPSPRWLQDLLVKAGLRPVSALVDVTNYLAIGFGRPLHVYDIAKLSGGLVARRARAGETLAALNGRTYTLDPTMCVIADDVAVHDIGGIMGGAGSGVSEATTDVLIEAAWFRPERIAATGRALGIASEARARFERGVDPGFVATGLDLAAAMMRALAGGEVSAPVFVGAPPAFDRAIPFDPRAVGRLAGLDVPEAGQRAILERLGFRFGAEGCVAVPSWRRDVEGPADLVEEIVRMVGLDQIEARPLPRAAGVARPVATPEQRLERRVRRSLAARGLDEAITWSFIAEAAAAPFGGSAHRLLNPLSAELAVMRPSLLPGLLAAAARNAARGSRAIRLFEIGKRYLEAGERPTVGLLLAGEAEPRHWQGGKARAFDGFDAKAEALAVLAEAGVPTERLAVAMPGPAWYHPGRSGGLVLGSAALAVFGELHPAVAAAFELALPVAAAEVFLDALPPPRARGGPFRPSPFQPLVRDFAFLVPREVEAQALVRAIAGVDRALIAAVEPFDRYEGPGVPEGQVSLAVSVTLQPRERTLTEAEIEAVAQRIVGAAAALGGVLRA
ncbi:phenylalanine--tRNA ligase subunit beta [Thermaurantiacus sp.]